MNRESFISALRSKLTKLSQDELESAIGYYEEYFDEAGIENEKKVLEELGTPSQVAKQIMADYAIRESVSEPLSPSSGIKTIWIVILAILASPIALPLAFAGLALVFSAFITIAALVFAGGVVVFTFFTTGVALFGMMFRILFIHPMTAVLCLGVSVVMIGIGLLAVVLVHWMIKGLMPIVVRGISSIFEKTKRGATR
ncbi:MAG: DUF1700 domain-containing protein [Cellulosilyticaceae bacterium]